MISSIPLVRCLRFSMHSIMSSANSGNFTSYFPVWVPFIYFSSLIYMTWTSKIVLNKSGKSRHPCPFPDLRGNTFSFSPLIINVVIYDLYYVDFHSHFLKSFFSHKLMLNFIKSFFGIC